MRRELVGSVLGFVLVGAFLVGARVFVEPVRVVGMSMHPALQEGDVALVYRRAEPAIGDIALIDEPGHGPVLHRVVDRDRAGRLRTKGDANPTEDFGSTRPEHVHGRVTAVVPLGGLLEQWR